MDLFLLFLAKVFYTHRYVDWWGDRSESAAMSARARQVVIWEHAEDRRIPVTRDIYL